MGHENTARHVNQKFSLMAYNWSCNLVAFPPKLYQRSPDNRRAAFFFPRLMLVLPPLARKSPRRDMSTVFRLPVEAETSLPRVPPY